jgi:hypothetical protein
MAFMEEQQEIIMDEVAPEETEAMPEEGAPGPKEEVRTDFYGKREEEGFWSETKFNKKAYEQMYKSLTGRMVKMLYSDEMTQNLDKVLAHGNPVETIGQGAAFLTVRAVEENSRMGNEKPPSSVLVVSGMTLVGEMIDYGEHKQFFQMSDDEKQAARALAIQTFCNEGIKRGWLDRDALADEMKNEVVMGSREERSQLNKELIAIDKAARGSVEKYGSDMQGIPAGMTPTDQPMEGGV